jgi:hypothetical protein
VRAGDRLRLGATVAFEPGPEPAKGEQRAIIIDRKPDDILLGLGSGAYSAKLLAGTKHRLSGFNQPRQSGDVVLRILVTGGPPVRGGGGMPHRRQCKIDRQGTLYCTARTH